MTVAPTPIPLEIPERMMLAVRDIVDLHIRCELEFDHALDEDRLRKAFRMLAERYPFLAMGVTMDGACPAFIPLPETSRDDWIRWLNPDAFERYLAGPHDCLGGPQLRMGLSKREEGGVRVAFIASHMAVDAAGMRQCLRELGQLYTALGAGGVTPAEGASTRRDLGLLVPPPEARGIAAKLTFVRHIFRMVKPFRSLSPVLPEVTASATMWRRENWRGTELERLRALARSEGGTLNDLFAAAVLLAVARLNPEGAAAAWRITLTADLRRFVPDPSLVAPANLSNVITVTIDRKQGVPEYRPVLRAVVAETLRLKRYGMGLQGLSMIKSLNKLPFVKLEKRLRGLNRRAVAAGAVPTAMTNLGQLLPDDVCFDQPAKTAVGLAPPMFPPRALFSLSGYQDTVCLALPVFAEAADAVEQLVSEVRRIFDEAVEGRSLEEGAA